jgi:hypothetical protein
MQYAQQALSRLLVDKLQRDGILGKLIGFDDQLLNQQMAREGSITGALATLDLSEASDRVVNRHVVEMMESGGIFRDAVQDCRSRRADVRGEVITLSKFASMGSALTFPIEAMFFLCLICVGIEDELKRPLTHRDLKSLVGSVRVYGDDIIVPVEYVPSVVRTLESFSLKVNSNKSFWNGNFRESCGKEYYRGFDVSLVKVRSFFPSRPTDTQEIVSTVSLTNQLHLTGLWETARWVADVLEELIPLPVVSRTSPVRGLWSFTDDYQIGKIHGTLHSPLVRGMVEQSKKVRRETDDIFALLKWFLKEGDQPFFDKEHLKYSGRPIDVSIKIRWASPF